eukprot:TRINITY_DN45429_c0_g1_i1.p1 TRINITY_DN45429_c0_g1~~TRINITY_DN45429_c0_g1_i1.p1  ORF type:complete len:119 (-),score=42.92 TRINITY_DN45429_c0_g1_i1:73-429(-)
MCIRDRYYRNWGVSLRNYLLAKQKAQNEAAAAEKKRLEKAKAKEDDQRLDKAAMEAIAKRKAQMMGLVGFAAAKLSLIHISEPTRLLSISYAVFCLKKKNPQINMIITYSMILGIQSY